MQYVTNRPPRYPAIEVTATNAAEVADFIPAQEYEAAGAGPARIFDQYIGEWRELEEGLWLVNTPIFIFVLTPVDFANQFQIV